MYLEHVCSLRDETGTFAEGIEVIFLVVNLNI